jgi:hypothetical protein
MSARQEKKIRQLYRKDLGKQAEAQAKEIERRMNEFTEKLDEILKPAPRFIPEFIWVSLQRLFLNI